MTEAIATKRSTDGKSRTRRPRLLFVNPYIHDVAAHDVWVRPLGLLHLVELAEAWGFGLDLVDVLDRHHPAWAGGSDDPRGHSRPDGTGHFHKAELEKPACLSGVRRRFCRYGAPIENVKERLGRLSPPDVVFLTSSMTYWFSGVCETAELIRECFPRADVVLGGTYATLMPGHARRVVRPDRLVAGPGEEAFRRILEQAAGEKALPSVTGWGLRHVWRHYPTLHSYPLLTSRGCLLDCSFCASSKVSPPFVQAPVEEVVEEISHASQRLGQSELVFFDDALLARPDRHIKPILRRVVEMKSAGVLSPDLHFHTPNGLMARQIDSELADLMRSSGFVRPRLSLETVSNADPEAMSNKVTREEHSRAVALLHRAGYAPEEIVTYLLVGLAGQSIEDIRRDVGYVLESGSSVSVARLSPIPGTREHLKASIPDGTDPRLLSNTLYLPLFRPKLWEQLEPLIRDTRSQCARPA